MMPVHSPAAWHGLAGTASQLLALLATEALLASVVFTVVLCTSRLLSRRSPDLLYGLWCLVFLRLMLPPGLSHPLSAGELLGRITRHGADQQTTGVALNAALPPTTVQSPSSSIGLPNSPWNLPLAALWLAGTLTATARIGHRRWRLQRLLVAARQVEDDRLLALLETWRQRLGVRRQIRLLTSCTAAAPFTTGVLRPVIFVPQAVLGLRDEGVIESVLAHELAHVARWDSLWLALQHVVQAVYFFHPLVWIAGARLGHERERLCDAAVLDHDSLPARVYAGSIVEVLQLGLGRVGVPGLGPGASRTRQRLQSILNHDLARRGSTPLAALVVLLLGAFVLPLTSNHDQASAGPVALLPSESSPQQPASGQEATEVVLTDPLPGSRISCCFGPARDPFSHELHHHNGIDLAAAAGTPVLAAASGAVVRASAGLDNAEAWGTVVVIDHGDGLQTVYAHLQESVVVPGQQVWQGEVVARVGSSGRSTGPHLHFEVRRNGTHVDPARLIARYRR